MDVFVYGILPSLMTTTTHATLGAVIGVATGSIWIAFLAGFISHFLIDIIPHGDREMYDNHTSSKPSRKQERKAFLFVTIDALVAIIVLALMFAFSEHTVNAVISAGIIGSILPDLIVVIQDTWNVKSLQWFHKLHFFFHNMVSNKFGDIRLRSALVAQLIFVVALQRYF